MIGYSPPPWLSWLIAWVRWAFFKVFKTRAFIDSIEDVADDSPAPDDVLRCPKCRSDQWQREYEGGSGARMHCRNNHSFMYVPGFGLFNEASET